MSTKANPNNLSQILRSFRKCGFALVVPQHTNRTELYEWAVKAAALAHGYQWDGNDEGDDDISKLIRHIRRTGEFHFALDVELGDASRIVWAYAEELLQHSVSQTNEQVRLGVLRRSPIEV